METISIHENLERTDFDGKVIYLIKGFYSTIKKPVGDINFIKMLPATRDDGIILGAEGFEGTIISCNSLTEKELVYIEDILVSLIKNENESKSDINEIFAFLVGTISQLRMKQTESCEKQVGLIGELFIIEKLSSEGIDPTNLISLKENSKFDFSITVNEKIEVKTTTKQKREHHFRLDQIKNSDYDIVVASVLLKISEKGETVSELLKRVKHLMDFKTWARMREKIMLFGEEIEFDSQITKSKIRYFDSDKIPQPINEESKVKKVSFETEILEKGRENYEV